MNYYDSDKRKKQQSDSAKIFFWSVIGLMVMLLISFVIQLVNFF